MPENLNKMEQAFYQCYRDAVMAEHESQHKAYDAMADEYREERRLARKAEYERYQPSILEV